MHSGRPERLACGKQFYHTVPSAAFNSLRRFCVTRKAALQSHITLHRSASVLRVKQTIRRIGVKRRKIRVEATQCTTLGTQNLVLVTHLQKNVRVILRRGLTDALEFFGADANLGHAAIITEFRVDMAVVGPAHYPEGLNGRHGVIRLPPGATAVDRPILMVIRFSVSFGPTNANGPTAILFPMAATMPYASAFSQWKGAGFHWQIRQ